MTPYIHASDVLPSGILPLRRERLERTPWVELGWPGMESKSPCLNVFLFDDSGSVTAPHGSDPVGSRFSEAEQAIRLVADWTFTDKSKIAILHFDHLFGASGVQPMNRRHLLRRLTPTLRTPFGAPGSSDLLPSLRTAEHLVERHEGHDALLTVFSDFELTDPNPSKVMSRLLAFPGTVHAVVLGGHPPLDIVDVPNVIVTPLKSTDPTGTFAAALHRSLTATRRGARPSVLHTATSKEALP